MTFLDAKAKTANLLLSRQDVSLPGDEVVKTLINQNILNIANRHKIINLLVKDAHFKVLRVLDKEYSIRMPKEVAYDDDLLDIDKELEMAVVNFVAADVSNNAHNRNIFKQNANKIVKDYSFKIYKTKDSYE